MKWMIPLIVMILSLPCLYAQETSREAHMELGYVMTSGNTETQSLSGKADVKLQGEKNRLFFQSRVLYSRSAGVEVANRRTVGLRWELVFTGRLFGFLGVDYLRDHFAGFRHRFSIGPGLGYDILKSEIHKLKGLVSVTYIVEDYAVEDVESEGFGSLTGSLFYEWQIRENVLFKTQSSASSSMENTEKYYLSGEVALEVAVSSRFSLGVGYRINYQNLVPGPDIENTDTSFMTSLIVHL